VLTKFGLQASDTLTKHGLILLQLDHATMI